MKIFKAGREVGFFGFYNDLNMEKIKFFKYQGTGNDFIMIDDRARIFDADDNKLIEKMCHRRFGVGADGLILIRNHPGVDFELVYFNSDGYPGTLCGNGSRCAVHFARHIGMVNQKVVFKTVEGNLEAVIRDDLVYVHMPDVNEIVEKGDAFFLNTGSPHHVCFVKGLETYDVYQSGKSIRYSDAYREGGTNVNFVEPVSADKIFVRTYERGVEDETLSCGTGVTASAIAYGLQKGHSDVKVKTLGGDLEIRFKIADDTHITDVHLIGPAQLVFEGEVDLRSF